MSITSEKAFESAIEDSLLQYGQYKSATSGDYNKETGFFEQDIFEFLKSTQPSKWEKISTVHGSNVETKLLQRISKEIDLRGCLDVLRNGFSDYGVRFDLAYFKPATTLNPDSFVLYDKNILRVVRQVYYSKSNKNSVDIVLTLNGFPIVTMELKNQFTNQNIENAKFQYQTTRDKREILFNFNKRSLVHFSVDQDVVFMATKIEGDKTYWLPFNKGIGTGIECGAGNPPNPDGYKTAYLWEDILKKDSLMELVQRFIHLERTELNIAGTKKVKEVMIFPRYHQLDVVRKLISNVYNVGAGTNYLIQHSAGSGKSNSIAWLSYRLSSLHNRYNEKIFDSVIVVTDRKVLDQQLQDTIYQFEHKTGVVQKIDKDSTQLAEAITKGVNIIITTLQKFPYVIDKVADLPNRKYAVIIDEAHSSQGGESSKHMKQVLQATSLEEAEELEKEDDYSGEDMIRENIERSAKARGQQSNISFFGFTATPKYKTLVVFGNKDDEGKPSAFHLYSMKQAIEEGFILDVLSNYTTYGMFVKLNKSIDDDPELNKKKAERAIRYFVSLHPHNLSQKAIIIIEHFRNVVAKKIGGKAKAMVVTSSRLHAKCYYEEFQKYIDEMGYQNEMKILVAFSGKVKDKNYPEGVTEVELTKVKMKELPETFNQDEYKILIVADKYQTGFDQPLLHTMYVDKKLSGVKAVQTLSRLNRMASGKEDTFVLDFANDRQVIEDSFQPYFTVTTAKEEPDINHLYDLKLVIDKEQIYWENEIEQFAKVYFKSKTLLSKSDQSKLYSVLEPALGRYKQLEEENQEKFKKSLRTWCNLYSFLAQIMPFVEYEFEKFYPFAKYLLTRLPKENLSEALSFYDEVSLSYYRIQKLQEGSITLQYGEKGELSGTTEAGISSEKEEFAPLSTIIELANERFGTEFDEADQLFVEQVILDLINDELLQTQARVNKIDTFKFAFDELAIDKMVERMSQNEEVFNRITGNIDFKNFIFEHMRKDVYQRINNMGV
ncbi:MAG: type I restriction endonuclease subunit R [Ignavibacteria bacterium]|nr:type I restriction endonuclease subunit R [Ignavibacteria bacterium]